MGCVRSWATLTLSRLPDLESDAPVYPAVGWALNVNLSVLVGMVGVVKPDH